MADKQISALTAVTEHTDSDLFVVQQSTTAKKTTLSTLKAFIYKIANISSTASSISDANYFLVSQSGTPKKVTASTLKSYCGSGGGGSAGVLYATYGSTTLSAIETAYSNGYAIFCQNNASIATLGQLISGYSATFYVFDGTYEYMYTVDSNDTWSTSSRHFAVAT